MLRAHNVLVVERTGRCAFAEAAALGYSVVLPARQISDRGEFGAVVCAHRRVRREVNISEIPFIAILIKNVVYFATKYVSRKFI